MEENLNVIEEVRMLGRRINPKKKVNIGGKVNVRRRGLKARGLIGKCVIYIFITTISTHLLI